MRRFLNLFTGVWALGFLLDQLSKQVAQTHLSFDEPWVVIPDRWVFQLVHNFGAAYGIFQNQRLFLVLFGTGVLFAILFFRKTLATSIWSKWALTFLVMGTCGNLLDRALHGYVIDFIYIYIFPVFNFADVYIDVGIALFFIELWVKPKT